MSDPGDEGASPRALSAPVPLDATHGVHGFDCGKAPLNDFLVRHALQNQAGGGARTYVLVTEGRRVVGYYSLAPCSVAVEEAPARVRKGQPRHPIPAVLMARFAVDRSFQGRGIGRTLFFDALARSLRGAEEIGGRAFVVHAKDDEAKAFYLRFGMEASDSHPLHLFLLFKDVRRTLGL